MGRLLVNPLDSLGRMLLILGSTLVLVALLLLLLARLPLAGRLPGDLHFRSGNVSCYFPVVTGIVVSILATLVLNLLLWLLRK
ncbi:MAG: DUF2905 domain-containing protein [Anaerolineae bacterium]|nr:DUF2905 domain-containing protein [Anaerolineae bacterium]